MQTVAIIDYGSGNLRSAAKAFERAAVGGHRVLVTADPAQVRAADRVVLPGVGAFADCMAGLSAVPGMRDALEETVRRNGRPFFGICVGMQLMATTGREFGEHPGLGWIGGAIVALEPEAGRKVPHMGWNELEPTSRGRDHPVLAGLTAAAAPHAYFVHSYRFETETTDDVLATVGYGGPVAAVIGRDNMVGSQFHPEKSQSTGLGMIANFLEWTP